MMPPMINRELVPHSSVAMITGTTAVECQATPTESTPKRSNQSMTAPSPLRAPDLQILPGLKRVAMLAVLALACLGSDAFAQEGKDQVTHYNPRTERVAILMGVVESNSLEGVTVKTAEDKSITLDADRVLRIVWGNTPQTYRDGRTYWTRGDFESALAPSSAWQPGTAKPVKWCVPMLACSRLNA